MTRLRRVAVLGGTAFAAATVVAATAFLSSGNNASFDKGGDQSLRSEPTEDARCRIPPDGPISVKQLPEGSSVVECDAVGRFVVWRGKGVTVPSPGNGVTLFSDADDWSRSPGSFGVVVSEAGTVSYEFPSDY